MRSARFFKRHKAVIGWISIGIIFIMNVLEVFNAQNPLVETLAIYDLGLSVALGLFFAWLLRVEKNDIKSKDEFLSMVSHELRTPLTTVKLQTELLKKKISDPEQVKMVDAILSGSRRMSQIIDSLLDITKVKLGRVMIYKNKTDLVPIIRETAKRLEIRDIRVDVPESLEGFFDNERIGQVFENVLSNAIKFGQGRPIEIKAFVESGVVKIQVTDSGIGLSKRDQIKLFSNLEKGIGAHVHDGEGIGLYIANEIVKYHGGQITVDSKLGVGSTFTVVLPLS